MNLIISITDQARCMKRWRTRYGRWAVDALDEETFEVFLNEKGKLRWRGHENGEEVILTKEPQTTWGKRFAAGFFRIIPMRAHL